MKIYNKIVIDMNTNEVLEEDSFEYDGPVAYCAPVIPYIPLIAAGLGVGGSLYSANQAQKNAESNAEDAEAAWKRNAFPSAEAVEAQKQSDTAKLSSERTSAYTNAIREMSSRGIGPGSGILGGRAAGIEGQYLKGLSNIGINATNMANTPRFGYPNAGYSQQIQPSGGGAFNPLGMALGMFLGKNQAQAGTPTSYDIPDNNSYFDTNSYPGSWSSLDYPY